MGAGVIHGIDLEKRLVNMDDGRTLFDLLPVEGGFEFPAYSSVEEFVNICEAKGVPREVWPIYYGVNPYDIDLDDVRERCKHLRSHLANVEDTGGNVWLTKINKWLRAGEIFVVVE